MARQASDVKVLYILLALVVVIVMTLVGYQYLSSNSDSDIDRPKLSPGMVLEIDHQFVGPEDPIRVFADAQAMDEWMRVQQDPMVAARTEHRLWQEGRIWTVPPGTKCEYVQGDERQAEVRITEGENAEKMCVIQPTYLFPPK